MKYKNQTGFTLIEMLVSISIIALISGIFFVNYRGTNKKSQLINTAQKLASDIRLAQNYCLGLKKIDGAEPAGGWGVYLDQGDNSYVIFADKNDPDGNKKYDSGEEFREIFFPQGISIDSIFVGGASVENSHIVFFPPDPVTYINDNATDVSITLKDQNNSTSVVKVNFLGLIEVE